MALFAKVNLRGYQPARPGLVRKTLAYGEHTLLTEFRMRRGSTLPAHAHPQEQTGYLISGSLRLTIGRQSAYRLRHEKLEVSCSIVLHSRS